MRPRLPVARPRSRRALFLVVGSVTLVGPMSMDSYLPGLPGLADDLGAGPSAAQLTLATFLVGCAVGQLISGPLSDLHGRRRPLLAGIGLFTVMSLLCAIAPTLPTLALFRFIQGAAVSTGMTIGRAIVRDLYEGVAAARFLSHLMMLVGLGPIIAPIGGGQILRFTSWRGTFVALALFGVALVAAIVWLLPETLPPERRHGARSRETARMMRHLFGDRSFAGLVLVSGLAGGAMVSYVTGSSFVLEKIYGTSPQLYSLLYGANAVLLIVGAQLNAHLLGTWSPRALLGFGLGSMVAGAVTLFAVVLIPRAGLAAVMPPLAVVAFSWGFIQPNTLALAFTPHPTLAGSASALIGVAQFTSGALLAPIVGIGSDHSALAMVIVIGVCALAAALVFRLLVPDHPDTAPAVVEPVGIAG